MAHRTPEELEALITAIAETGTVQGITKEYIASVFRDVRDSPQVPIHLPSGSTVAVSSIAGVADEDVVDGVWTPAAGSGTTLQAIVPAGTFDATSVQGHGAATVAAGVLDLTPDVGTPYDAEISAGAGATTLITCPIPTARRQVIGVDWNVYNTTDTLAGYQTVVTNRVGSDAPTILASPFDSATVQTAVAWSPRVEVSGSNVLVRITADATNAIRAKVRAELLQSIDISDAPVPSFDPEQDLIDLLTALSGFWWRADDATDAGGGLAGTIPDAVANANTLTFNSSGSFQRPAIGVLSAAADVALIFNKYQQASPATSLGVQTSHTFLVCREHATSASIQSLSWGGGNSAAPGLVVGWQTGANTNPSVFATSAWIAEGTDSVAGTYELVEFWLDDTADEARVYRDGTQTGATGTYSSSLAADLSAFGCSSAAAYAGLAGRVTDFIYIPSAIDASARAAIRTSLKGLHASLP